MLKKQFLILFIISLSPYSSCFIADLVKLAQTSWKVMLCLNDVSFSHDTVVKVGAIFSGSDEGAKVVEQLTMMNEKLDDLKNYTSDRFNRIELLLNSLPEKIDKDARRRNLDEFRKQTDDKWHTLMQFQVKNGTEAEYVEFARKTLDTIGENLSKFRSAMFSSASIDSSDFKLFRKIAERAREEVDIQCDQGETYHQTLVRLFQKVLMTEIKAHTLLGFAYSVKLPGGRVLFSAVKKDFTDQFLIYLHEFKNSVNLILPYIRACDPEDAWRRNENFYELEGLIQRTVYRENPDCPPLKNDCSLTNYECPMVHLNPHSACTGQLHDCSSLTEPFRITDICVWNEGPYKIRYVHNADDRMGVDLANACPTEDFHQFNPWRHIVGPILPPFCECQCSDKWYFVADMKTSRIYDNFVVVGLRFNKLRNYIYIQIAEGKLGSNGYISDFSWVSGSVVESQPWSNVEVWSLSAYETRIFFNDEQLPPGYILTGVSLSKVTVPELTLFSIEIQGMKFDYGTGKLNFQETSVKYPSFLGNRQLKYEAKNPTRMSPMKPQLPDSKGYDYILIRQSDRDDDFGQATLPFFDALPVLTNPLSPIGGVGLFHKSNPGYAGFLSLRIYPINYTYYIDDLLEHSNLTSLFASSD